MAITVSDTSLDFAIIFSSKVNIKEDGKCIADNDGSHTLQTKYGFAELEPCLHDIRLLRLPGK